MNINDHIEKVLVTEEERTKRCKEIAEEISKEYEEKTDQIETYISFEH